MSTPQQWVGIDISLAYLDVAIHPLNLSFRLPNNEMGHSQLVEKISGYEIGGIVLESTGGYERPVMLALEAAGYQTSRVNPAQVRYFAKAAGKWAKTDCIDAQMLAHFGESLRPAVTVLPDAATREMQALVSRRQQVVALLTVEKNRLHSCESWVRESITQTIKYLESQLETLESRLTQLSTQCSQWQERLKLITSVKGIGSVISQALLVGLPELGQISHKQLAARVGVAPFNRDSGQFRGQRRIRGGRKELRSLLYMGIMSAVQHNQVFRDHYQQLLQRGKPKKVALVACIRKLLGVLNAMIRDNKPWCEPPQAQSLESS
jgi:transposase